MSPTSPRHQSYLYQPDLPPPGPTSPIEMPTATPLLIPTPHHNDNLTNRIRPPSQSDRSYPHQSSLESDSTPLQAIDGGQREGTMSPADDIKRGWQNQQQNRASWVEERDIVPELQHQYASPYDNSYPNPGFEDPAPSYPPIAVEGDARSIGPWDSASQRSFPLGRKESAVRYQPSNAGLSYVDQDGVYHHSNASRPPSGMVLDEASQGLLPSAAGMGHNADQSLDYGYDHDLFNSTNTPRSLDKMEYIPEQGYGDLNPAENPGAMANYRAQSGMDQLLFATGLDRLLGLFGVNAGKFPVEQAIERKRRGLGGQRYPVAAWGLAIAMTAVLIVELVTNYHYQGTPIAIHPSFNYMIGPSSEILVNIGARFPPCMKYVSEIPPTFDLACLNDTSNPPTTQCTVEQICGHGGWSGSTPDQSWRFVLPIFLHVGIVHLLVNMIAQITVGAQIEREMGTLPFLIVYMAGGIYGFVLGGNFSRVGVPSVGASGALFATNACVLVDLLLHWKYEERPKLKAFLLAVEFLIGMAVGYIPNAVDGLAHIGGFAMGLLTGVILYPSISETKRHRYIVWGCRIVAIPLIIVAFVLTIKNFYTADPNAACEWCKYLSCIPTSSNERCTGTGITTTTVSTNSTSTRRGWDL